MRQFVYVTYTALHLQHTSNWMPEYEEELPDFSDNGNNLDKNS